MNEAGFDALSEHLREVRPIIDDFCARHGFAYMPRAAIGRYPRIRIAREGSTKLYFDLQMELDEKGQRFEQFRPDLPYALCAGASIVEDDGSKYGVRFQKGFICFSGRPFEQVAAVLQSEMEKHLPTLEAWDARYLKENGEKIQLGT
ncbi:MAG TPA: hypothetical protein PK640_13920 [Verrucomicrobiota bacterium]|nr:hypothetical protein [Verrucomicrobiota bacterium]